MFSPLAGEPPPEDADAVYLPGGYPELHAGRLAANTNFLDGLRRAAARSAFIYGECGGFMVLGQGLIDKEGERHAMAGLLPVTTSFENPKRHLGYRSLTLKQPCPLGPAGTTFRGHEFHYSSVERVRSNVEGVDLDGAQPLFGAKDARGTDKGEQGLVLGSVAGSFMHLIDRVAEPSDADFRSAGPLHVVRD